MTDAKSKASVAGVAWSDQDQVWFFYHPVGYKVRLDAKTEAQAITLGTKIREVYEAEQGVAQQQEEAPAEGETTE